MSKRILYNISSANLQAANISGGTVSGTTLSGGSLSLSGNLNVAGTLTTVNITSTNLVNTNVSAGVVVASTLLSATGNSNTIGNIFTTGGNVGIGTTSPGYKLDINGSFRSNSTGVQTFVIGSGSGTTNHSMYLLNTYGNFEMAIAAGAGSFSTSAIAGDTVLRHSKNMMIQNGSGSSYLYLTSSGNVGINTASPNEKLEVAGALKISSNTSPTNDNLAVYMYNQSGVGPTIAGGQFEVRTNGNNPRLRIDGSGNVGIGTIAPTHLLSVGIAPNSTTKGSISINTSGESRHHLYNSAGVAEWLFGQKTFSRSDFTFSKLVAGTETDYLTISTGGNVGIGTTSPGAKLQIDGNEMIFKSNFEPSGRYWTISNPTSTTNTTGSLPIVFNTGNAWDFQTDTVSRLFIEDNGNVGIGTTDPGASLHVAGSLPITSGNGICSGIDPSGNSGMQINSGTSTSGHAYIDFGYRGNDFQSRILHSNQTKSLQIQVNGSNSPTVFLASTGNVGVGTGTNNVVSALHLSRNGSTVGNIIFEPGFTSDGGNAYFTAISVNGYHSAGEQRIGANKNRWRMYFDQRTGAESFGIDTWNGATGTTVMTIGSTGNVSVPTLWTNYIGINGAASAKQFASGLQGGGAATGNTSFGITFGYIPNVVACISQNDTTAVFGVQIVSISTTGFTYRKTFYRFNGGYGGDAVSESFYWFAM